LEEEMLHREARKEMERAIPNLEKYTAFRV
jgi:hypothetical protein